MTQDRKQNLNQ